MKNKILNRFWQNKYHLLVMLLISFLLGYFVTSFLLNPYNGFYSYRFSTTEIINKNDLISNENIEYVISSNEKFAYLGDKKLSADSLLFSLKSEEVEVKAKIHYFKSSSSAKSFLSTLTTSYASDGVFEITKTTNPYIAALIATGIGLLIGTIFLLNKDFKNNKKIIYDNKDIYKTPFHKSYWVKANLELKKISNIVLVAILIALMMVVKLITLPSGFGNLGLSFGYLFFSIACLLYGPLTGLIMGFVSDIVGFYLFPGGFSFNPLYTLNAMLAGFTYGIFFYKTKISFTKCLYARIIVNLAINVVLGSFWAGIDYKYNFDQIMNYMFIISLPKNLVYLIPQSILLFVCLKSLMPAFKALNLVDLDICNNVTII